MICVNPFWRKAAVAHVEALGPHRQWRFLPRRRHPRTVEVCSKPWLWLALGRACEVALLLKVDLHVEYYIYFSFRVFL